MNEALNRKAEKIATKRIVSAHKRSIKMLQIGKRGKKKQPPAPTWVQKFIRVLKQWRTQKTE